ncbi:MAG: hypothetical protein ACKOOH_10450 [Cyanobium sp.]
MIGQPTLPAPSGPVDDNGVNRLASMTIALLIALAGSLGLMVLIVKRLEQA